LAELAFGIQATLAASAFTKRRQFRQALLHPSSGGPRRPRRFRGATRPASTDAVPFMQNLLGLARTPHANSAKTQNDVIKSLIIKPHHINNYNAFQYITMVHLSTWGHLFEFCHLDILKERKRPLLLFSRVRMGQRSEPNNFLGFPKNYNLTANITTLKILNLC